MICQVKLTSYANSVVKKFSPGVRKAAKAVLKELAKNPYFGKELQTELSGFWSYRFLRYRFIFKADTQNKIIIVWAIGFRRDIYEAFGDHLLNISPEDEESMAG